MKKTAYIIYNHLQTPEEWRFFTKKSTCQKEINRVFPPALKKLGKIKPVKATIEFDV